MAGKTDSQQPSNWYLSGDVMVGYRKLDGDLIAHEGGPKGYIPTGDLLERKRIQASLRHRQEMLSVQRIQKQSNLSQATWNNKTKEIMVIWQVGHSWTHSGYTRNRQLHLFPEEALFLVDSNQLELYYEEIPMSLQESYSHLLSIPDSCTLQSYQVYSFLSKLGYLVIRTNRQNVFTDYEKLMNLDQFSHNEIEASVDLEPTGSFDSGKFASNTRESKSIDGSNESLALKYNEQTSWKGIEFPDLRCSRCIYVKPNQGFFPTGINCRFSVYRIQSRSRKSERNRHRRGRFNKHIKSSFVSAANSSERPRCACDEDDECATKLCGENRWYENDSTPPCRNILHKNRKFLRLNHLPTASDWKRLKSFAAVDRKHEHKAIRCLWSGEVKPLLNNYGSAEDRSFNELKVIREKRIRLDLDAESSSRPNVFYDVYLPNKEFRRSCPGAPNHRIVVVSASDPVPNRGELLRLRAKYNDDIPIHFAVVNNGKMSFYIQQPVSLPHNPYF